MPMWPTQYNVVPAANDSTSWETAFKISPMMVTTTIRMKPSHRPQMSMILAMVKLITPPMILAMRLAVVSRPCWPKDDVT